ncbi:E3 ubiquitin-protein ligase ATL6-like [Prosopis cineraria]|uniref:E3 ubiquitin-protein ligase ATL6-like n=1 Tax=Prosopis cineraria TaxID=364024 RepID=UPI0024101260|nr:E3 ubiquitin-protein ligase ATL6-like [Prosopis cineraria]
MIQTTRFHFTFLTWVQLLFRIFVLRAAAQSAVQPVPSFASHQNWDPSIAAMVGALFCAFLFIGFFSVYLRHCSDEEAATGQAGECSCSCSEGIDRKVLDTFPILVYSTIKDLKIGKGALECAVCLNEFKDYETLRLLPKCNHVFHPSCIEAWLSSHVTCPVCREKLNPDYDQVAITVPPQLNVIGSSDNNRRDEHEETEENESRSGSRGGEVEEDGAVAVGGDQLKSGRLKELRRSNSTGHCEVERYTLKLPEDVRKYILVNHHGAMRRSASYNVVMSIGGSPRKGLCRNEKQVIKMHKEDIVPTPPLVP